MGYGMLVRYNAHKWEKFIDPKTSKESTLIGMSLNACVRDYIILLHEKLFGSQYTEEKYDDFDVKKVIKDSTKDIMNNITKEIAHENIIFGTHYLLP